MSKRPLSGSERKAVPGARSIGTADPAERLEVSIVLRQRDNELLRSRIRKLTSGEGSDHCLNREEFARQFGADPADIAAVKVFADRRGLAVVQESAARRTVVLSGTVAQFNAAFDVDLQQFEHDGGTYRGRTGPIHLPDELIGIVEAVLGLDNRPQARPHFRNRLTHGNVNWRAALHDPTSFTPPQLASLYNFPAGSGQGQCIGIIELGGGYRLADLTSYFAALGLAPPQIATVSVDHGRNQPTGDANGPDGEVMLDIEIAGAIAPSARIVVYFAPNTDAGFLDAITTAIHDTINKPSVISISWGRPESAWIPQSMAAFDDAFQAAAAMGITIIAAAGDSGSGDGIDDGTDHVDFPASSAFVLACGGTSLQAAAGKITRETVWNNGANGGATGGGVSTVYALPPFQQSLKATDRHGAAIPLKMRGVPDVAAVADPQTGYDLRVDGNDIVGGGTSAVAPLWAGLIARLNAARDTPLGYVTPLLYKNASALNDVTQGNNGDFAASPGWDACTGLGSPNGSALLAALGMIRES